MFCAVRWAINEPMQHVEHMGGFAPLVLTRKLYEIVAIAAQQFRGYMFRMDEPKVGRRG